MKIKRYLSQNRLTLFIRLIGEYLIEINLLSKELGTYRRRKVLSKFKADLTIRFHAIEKGMSIGRSKPGFGQNKIISALKDLSLFYNKFKDEEFVSCCLSIVDAYLNFQENKNVNLSNILNIRNEIYEKLNKNKSLSNIESGIYIKNRRDTLNTTKFDFPQFSNSRFSVRDFNPEIKVRKSDILDAINISKKAPSACNRQPWHVHLFSGNSKNQLLKFQGGCKGFSDDIEYAILITSDLNQYFINEINQSYVDGGLYGMNLLYALHYKGLATIPLTTAFKQGKLRKMKKKFKISQNQVPILIIGIGTYAEIYKVAVSHRIPFEKYIIEHNEE